MAETTYIRTGDLAQAIDNGRRLLVTNPRDAVVQAQEILNVDPANRLALRLLAAALRCLGHDSDAQSAELEAIRVAGMDQIVGRAAAAIGRDRLDEAEHLLRPYLRTNPEDPASLALLAEIASRLGIFSEAESIFRRVLEIVPGFVEARLSLGRVLLGLNRLVEALEIHDQLLASNPDDVSVLRSKAAVLNDLGRYYDAMPIHKRLLDLASDKADVWMSYGHHLKTIGRTTEAIRAYRKALQIEPDHGETWWSLANLKTVEFGVFDLADIQAALDRCVTDPVNSLHLHFTLGKVFEDNKDFPQSFRHFEIGNRIRRSTLRYEPSFLTSEVRSAKFFFAPALFDDRRGWGNPAPDPIFILGMPRAGSTLVEQILASHSSIEGISELPYVQTLVRSLVAARWQSREISYPELLGALDRKDFERLGSDYLARARPHRRTDKTLFTDKMPNNWTDIGFIHLILPNAKIIDARRHPLDCGMSIFKQNFARGQSFAYSLEEIGHQYRQYVELLAHFDSVLPGRIHRIIHERLVDDPETEIRSLLDYLDLPFEDACLRFHENIRPVRTASSEQVRRPLNRDGLGQWRAFEPWLEPLRTALGPVLDFYPDVPPSF